ncbi:MAG: hypothetical protein QXQ48_09340 [Nitrososphaerota archaeon]
MTRVNDPRTFLRHMALPVFALILIFFGLAISIYPLRVPVQYLTDGVKFVTTAFNENLGVSLMEETTSMLQPNTLMSIFIYKDALRKMPTPSVLQGPTITIGSPIGTAVWRGTPESTIIFGSVTTTRTVYLTDLELIYSGRTYRFVENEPLIIGKMSVVGSPIEFMLVDEENCARIAQNKPYQALYVRTSIVGSETISFRPPLGKEITGSYVCFIFLNKGDKQSFITYNFEIVWKVVRQDVLTTIGPVTTTSYTTIFLTDVGLPTLLIGLVILIVALLVKKFLGEKNLL